MTAAVHSQPAAGLSPTQLNAMRVGYLLMAVGLATGRRLEPRA